MIRHRAGLALAVAALCTLGGCVRPRFMRSEPEREWPSTLQRAQAAAEVGRFDVADSALAEFFARHPSSPEANETLFWRALFRLDPANPESSTSDAVTDLTAYLASPGRHQHLVEARALRRAALLADSLAGAPARRAEAGAVSAATDKDAEIARLKEELKKATEELERIKRRLSTPTP